MLGKKNTKKKKIKTTALPALSTHSLDLFTPTLLVWTSLS